MKKNNYSAFPLALILSISILLTSCDNKPQEEAREDNHEITKQEFLEVSKNDNTGISDSAPPSDPFEKDSIGLINQGYTVSYINNGAEPDCFNYSPKHGNLDNKLVVEVGGGTDVAIKMMSYSTGKCIRYFFVNSNSTYTVTNIPEGRYYLKIAYGKRWMMSRENNECKGRFLRNPRYEKGADVLDYNIIYHGNSYQIPSYKLRLDVVSTDIMSSFDSKTISEGEFNN